MEACRNKYYSQPSEAGADTGRGCRGCIPPTRPKEVLTWHLISLKIIAKILLYCRLFP